mmetsp:Transcript_4745/g.10750  ORF Transcript_4745/g.10750 Transcript_4745/m.10750 type:complete len:168 (-) Transcript_4745:1360-1863(-)
MDWEKEKDVDLNRVKLAEYMKKWSESWYDIEQVLYFDDDVVKDLINMKDVVGSTVPRLNNIDKGNEILTCAYRSLDDNEEAMRLDNLAERTAGNRNVEEEERLAKRRQRAPLQDYEELRRCLATYAALNFARGELHQEQRHLEGVGTVGILITAINSGRGTMRSSLG